MGVRHRIAFVPVGIVLLLAGCSRHRETTDSALQETLDAQRATGHYREALKTAQALVAERRRNEPGFPCQVAGAVRQVTGLQRILSLPDSLRQQVAEADRLSSIATQVADTAAARAVELLQQSVALRRRVFGERAPEVAAALSQLGAVLLNNVGDASQGLAALLEAVVLDGEVGDDDALRVWDALILADAFATDGDPGAADSLYREVIASSKDICGSGSKEYTAALSGLARLRADDGDFAAARPLYQLAISAVTESNLEARQQLEVALHDYGAFQLDAGEYPAAEDAFRRVMRLDQQTPARIDSVEYAATLVNLAWAVDEQGRADEAEKEYLQALRIMQGQPGADATTKALAQNSLGALYMKQAKYDSAGTLFREALAGVEQPGGLSQLGAKITLNLARNLREQRQFDVAEKLYRDALAILEPDRDRQHTMVERLLYSYASLCDDRGRFSRAESLYAEAARVYEASRLRIPRGFGRAAFQETPYPKLANARLRIHQPAAAWRAAEQGQSRVLVELLQASGGSALPPAEMAARDSLCRELDMAETFATETAQGGGESSPSDEAARDHDSYRRLLRAQAAWADFQTHLTEHSPVATGGAYTLAQIQNTVAPDAALVGWLDVEERTGKWVSWVYVVRESGPVEWHRLSFADSLASPRVLVERFRNALTDVASAGTNPAAPAGRRGVQVPGARRTAADLQAISRAMYERFRRAESALRPVHQLFVVPSGAMQGVPVEPIVMPDGATLGERFEVSYVPSGTVHAWLHSRRPRSPAAAPERRAGALVVGDPVFETQSKNHSPLDQLPPLPATRVEAQTVVTCIPGSTVLLGMDAREAKLDELAQTGALARFRVLHIATHSVVDNARPDQSKLVLTRAGLPDPVEAIRRGTPVEDGVITAAEIVRDWRLQADLVTLSACTTGLGQQLSGEGYVGLAQAFLQAGARSVLVSLWEVDDEATAALMQRFYQNLGVASQGNRDQTQPLPSRVSKAAALQEAKSWLRKSGPNRRISHPYFWAGFVLIGDPEPL